MLGLAAHSADRVCGARIAVISVKVDAHVDADDVAELEGSVVWDTVHSNVVYRCAYRCRESKVA